MLSANCTYNLILFRLFCGDSLGMDKSSSATCNVFYTVMVWKGGQGNIGKGTKTKPLRKGQSRSWSLFILFILFFFFYTFFTHDIYSHPHPRLTTSTHYPRPTRFSYTHWITTFLKARRILRVVSHFNLSVLANETLSVSLCREIDNVFGAVRTCFDHVLSKFSGFSWERILFLNSACVNMVMQIQVQIGDTWRVILWIPWECWGFKKLHFAWDSVLWILVLLYENDKGEHVVLNDVRMAYIRLASLVYVRTYYVPIAILRQNKPFRLPYLTHAQIIILSSSNKLNNKSKKSKWSRGISN